MARTNDFIPQKYKESLGDFLMNILMIANGKLTKIQVKRIFYNTYVRIETTNIYDKAKKISSLMMEGRTNEETKEKNKL